MNAETKDRLDQVYELLHHISNGNFNHRIPRSNQNDELEALITILNMMSENIQDSFVHQGYIAMHDSYVINNQVLLFIDDNNKIVYINPKGHKYLHYEKEELQLFPFTKILNKDSIKKWDDNFNSFFEKNNNEIDLKLTFRGENGLDIPANCTILSFCYNADSPNLILLTFPHIASNRSHIERQLKLRIQKKYKQVIHDLKQKSPIQILNHDDIKKIRKVGEFIIHNLGKPIPTLGTLAIQYGTNEFKLKKGFKELYGMTVLQYIKNERLKNAHVIAENTNIPVKQIAQIMGFKKANHFSREFKKRYGYSVSELRIATELPPY